MREAALAVLSVWDSLSASATFNPFWGEQFWQALAAREAQLPPALVTVLRNFGYVGPSTKGPPAAALRETLSRLSLLSAAPGGTGGFGIAPPAAAGVNPDLYRWHQQLAPDLKRAAPEIYSSLRAAGTANVREWLSQEFTGSRHSDSWVDLWTTATSIDFKLAAAAAAAGVGGMAAALNGDDSIEMGLRRLAAYVYQARTRDRTGAARMLAISPPGAGLDIAPSWLVNDVTIYSKNEHQRGERVTAADHVRQRQNKGDAKGDGKGKDGKGKGKGKGKGRGGGPDAAY